MKSVVFFLALCFLDTSLVNGSDTLEAIILDHAEELSATGNDVAAYRLLDRITNLDEKKFDKAMHLKVAIANKLLFPDERDHKHAIKVDSDLNLQRAHTYRFEVDPSTGVQEVAKYMYSVNGMFLDALKSESRVETKSVVYPANSSIVVRTSLRNHLKLMLIANSPIFGKRCGTMQCTAVAESVKLTNKSNSATR